MRRWISSISVTLALLLAAFFLPLWTEPNPRRENAAGEAEETARISTVRLVQRQAAVARSRPEPRVPPDFPTVAGDEERIEEPPEEVEPEEIEQDGEQTAETAEEASGADSPQEEMAASPAQQGNSGQGNSQSPANSEYRQYVLQRIASKKTYPRGARSKDQEGVVRLSITIGADGELLDSRVVEPSEHSLLNEASLLAVKRAAPFKKMPAGMEELNLVFSIDYSLR